MTKRSGIDCNGLSCATKGAGVRRFALVAALLAIVAGFAAPELAEARITRIQITRVESPTFEGTSFGGVGQYEKLVGRAYGEVDPADPKTRSSPTSIWRPRTPPVWSSTRQTSSS